MAKKDAPERGIFLRRKTYWFSQTVKGKRHWHNLETDDLEVAKVRKAEFLDSPRAPQGDSIKSAIARFIEFKVSRHKYTRNTVSRVQYPLAAFEKHCGPAATLATVQAPAIQRWYDRVRARRTDATAQQYLVTIRALFRWAVEQEKVRYDNPVKGVDVTKPKTTARVRFVTADQRDKLIAAADPDMKFILYCGFHAGLRRNEISEARVFWFDLSQKLLHVETTPLPTGTRWQGEDVVNDIYGVPVRPFIPKGKKSRTVPLTNPFAEFLKRYLADRDQPEFVMEPAISHTGRYRYNFRSPYAAFMRRQKASWVTPHILRHTFGSLLVQKGVSLYKVAAWLGDTQVVTERHYAHLAPVDADIHRLE
jgi:integrase